MKQGWGIYKLRFFGKRFFKQTKNVSSIIVQQRGQNILGKKLSETWNFIMSDCNARSEPQNSSQKSWPVRFLTPVVLFSPWNHKSVRVTRSLVRLQKSCENTSHCQQNPQLQIKDLVLFMRRRQRTWKPVVKPNYAFRILKFNQNSEKFCSLGNYATTANTKSIGNQPHSSLWQHQHLLYISGRIQTCAPLKSRLNVEFWKVTSKRKKVSISFFLAKI